MYIIHHNKDLDGFSSGAICKLKYPDATLIGWDYKDPIPDFEQFRNEDVIMIDITFPIDKLDELSKIVNQLTVIDHHISFCKDFFKFYKIDNGVPAELTKDLISVQNGNLMYVYDKDKAACEIGWEYLFPNTPIPYAITLLGRYDTWRKKEGNWDEETLPFQYYMRVYCTSAETFDKNLFNKDTDSDARIFLGKVTGRTIVKYQEQQDTLACERSSFERSFHGLRAICLNTRAFSSNTMASVYNPDEHDVMVGIEYTGNKWSVSLRSDKPDVDVSVIAKSRGGGGHKAAAGFETDNLENIFM
jgi:hypothetical protein